MPLVVIAGVFVLLLAGGCAGKDRAPQAGPPGTGTVREKPPAALPPPAAQQEAAVAAIPEQTAPKPDGPVAVEPAPPPSVPPTASTSPGVVAPEAPAAKLPAQAPAPKKEAIVPPAPKPAAPPLDLASLEKRLKETSAIGVFTKLTLKNQVDDLLDRFRAHYQGQGKTTLAALRQPYDDLLLKVLALLQDGDPPLAKAIAQSREAIWAILSNPDKFKNL